MQAVLLHKESVKAVPADQVVAAIAELVSDSDLLLTSASLQVGSTLLRCHPSSAAAVSSKMLQPALLLSQSSLLQVLEICSNLLLHCEDCWRMKRVVLIFWYMQACQDAVTHCRVESFVVVIIPAAHHLRNAVQTLAPHAFLDKSKSLSYLEIVRRDLLWRS